VGFGKYITAAFANRWNLLAFFGGLTFATISGQVDVVAPLVLAAEATYLCLLSSHPRFQKSVDARDASARRRALGQSKEQAVDHILTVLPKPAQTRFQSLRTRCLKLRELAHNIKQPGAAVTASGLDSLQLRGLDRLLWVFLRLLFTHHSLSRFLEETNPDVIQKDIQRTEQRLANMDPENKSAFQGKIRRTLEDNLKTCHDRQANYRKARENLEFVDLEIGRLENKIKSLAELAINRQEPDYISSQIDQVAGSMLDTEQTMNDLDFATGLSEIDDVVPQLLEQTQ
jgi:chemotaxis protein histidine kinase CheA